MYTQKCVTEGVQQGVAPHLMKKFCYNKVSVISIKICTPQVRARRTRTRTPHPTRSFLHNIWCTLVFIISISCRYPIRLGIVCWVITIPLFILRTYPTHMKHNKQTRCSKGANKHISIHLHECAWAQLVWVGVKHGRQAGRGIFMGFPVYIVRRYLGEIQKIEIEIFNQPIFVSQSRLKDRSLKPIIQSLHSRRFRYFQGNSIPIPHTDCRYYFHF